MHRTVESTAAGRRRGYPCAAPCPRSAYTLSSPSLLRCAQPWEAVLLVDVVDYLMSHFVRPCADAFPQLRKVTCAETRVPSEAQLPAARRVDLPGVGSGGGAAVWHAHVTEGSRGVTRAEDGLVVKQVTAVFERWDVADGGA
eukprot:356331-Chlamydomonas_euryale.AAC.1